jgi:hypothetical protein
VSYSDDMEQAYDQTCMAADETFWAARHAADLRAMARETAPLDPDECAGQLDLFDLLADRTERTTAP